MAKANTTATEAKTLTPSATPDNTPIPGGGSWRWDYTQHAWAANTSDQPLQPGDSGALQTFDSNQE